MLKQLKMEDIDQLIALREQDYSNNALSTNVVADKNHIGEFNSTFIKQAAYMLNVDSHEEFSLRFEEITQSLRGEEKSSFIASMASVLKWMSDDFETISNEQLQIETMNLLHSHCYEVKPNSLVFKTRQSKLRTSIALQQELLQSIFSEDFIAERELTSLISKDPIIVQTEQSTIKTEQHTSPLFSEVYK